MTNNCKNVFITAVGSFINEAHSKREGVFKFSKMARLIFGRDFSSTSDGSEVSKCYARRSVGARWMNWSSCCTYSIQIVLN